MTKTIVQKANPDKPFFFKADEKGFISVHIDRGANPKPEPVDLGSEAPARLKYTEKDLFALKKKDQVALLERAGLSDKEIRALRLEKDRVNKLLELQ